MDFLIAPIDNTVAGRHEIKISVTDQPQYHCECASDSIIVTAGIEV